MGNKDYDVHVMVSQNLLNQTDGAVRISENAKNISSFETKPHFGNLAQVNFAQVAKVCDTDV